MQEKRVNYWKWAFIILVTVLLLLFIYIVIQLQAVQTGEVNTEPNTASESEVTFEVRSEKDDLTQVVNAYLEEETQDDFIGYSFNLEDQAVLHGEFDVFGLPVQFSLYFEPEVLDNGNLLLHAEEISLGSLNLPISFVLSQVASQVDFPDFIAVDSSEETIAVNLNEFELDNGIQFSVNEINLPQNDIGLYIHLPIEAVQ